MVSKRSRGLTLSERQALVHELKMLKDNVMPAIALALSPESSPETFRYTREQSTMLLETALRSVQGMHQGCAELKWDHLVFAQRPEKRRKRKRGK